MKIAESKTEAPEKTRIDLTDLIDAMAVQVRELPKKRTLAVPFSQPILVMDEWERLKNGQQEFLMLCSRPDSNVKGFVQLINLDGSLFVTRQIPSIFELRSHCPSYLEKYGIAIAGGRFAIDRAMKAAFKPGPRYSVEGSALPKDFFSGTRPKDVTPETTLPVRVYGMPFRRASVGLSK